MAFLDNWRVQWLAPMYFGGWELIHRMTRSSVIAINFFRRDQVAIRLNMDGCLDSMAVVDLGKDPLLAADVEVVS